MSTNVRERLEACLLRGRGERVLGVELLPGGANSTVYKLASDGGRAYLAKLYQRLPGDDVDRLEVEFGGLSFLWEHGARDIPEPICMSPADRIGIYEFVAGGKLQPGQVTAGHVEQAARFLRELHDLARTPEARLLPAAKEASFTLQAYVESVEDRVRRLEALPSPSGSFRSLADFIGEDLGPFAREVAQWAAEEAASRRVEIAEELPPESRTLSPSDFGFHNALLRPDGRLVFIDFEYWGWDDPAKMVADFYLQPAVPVPMGLRRPFYDLVGAFLDREDLARRLPLVYPLLAVKWCLIMLNSFLRTPPGSGDDTVLGGQLDKSAERLELAREEFHRLAFPLNLL